MHHCKPKENEEDVDTDKLKFNTSEIYLGTHGEAITECMEAMSGELLVTNHEYTSRVNYCPYCGFKAIMQMELNNTPLQKEANSN